MPTVVVHLMTEDPFVAEIEEMPSPDAVSMTFVNPRKRDNKPLKHLEEDTVSVVYPWHRINYIEVRSEEAGREEVDLFFRT